MCDITHQEPLSGPQCLFKYRIADSASTYGSTLRLLVENLLQRICLQEE